MAYIEIYPIENSAKKISNQLDEVIAAKPVMYGKTRDRYKQLACSLLQSVEKISAILEDQYLATEHSDEFNALSYSDDTSSISEALDSVKSQISSYQSFSSSGSDKRTRNRDALQQYTNILALAEDSVYEYDEVKECAELIYTWFQTRFRSNVKDPNFVYNINQLPTWVTGFIVLYGKYHHNCQLPKLKQTIANWCEDVRAGRCRWAVPYEVHRIMKSDDPSDFTLDAVVIGDILMDCRYYALCDNPVLDEALSLSCSPVATVVKAKNSSLLPKIRTRMAKRAELVDECNLVPIEGGHIIE